MEGISSRSRTTPIHVFSGPTTPSTGQSASACFGRFFTDEVWDLLVEEICGRL